MTMQFLAFAGWVKAAWPLRLLTKSMDADFVGWMKQSATHADVIQEKVGPRFRAEHPHMHGIYLPCACYSRKILLY
jgi:hypothetical protein